MAERDEVRLPREIHVPIADGRLLGIHTRTHKKRGVRDGDDRGDDAEPSGMIARSDEGAGLRGLPSVLGRSRTPLELDRLHLDGGLVRPAPGERSARRECQGEPYAEPERCRDG